MRLYRIIGNTSAIRGAYARRADITGEDLIPAAIDDSSKSKPKKTEPKEEDSTEEEK